MMEQTTTPTLEVREAVLALHESMKPNPNYDTTDTSRQEEAIMRLASLIESEAAARGIADALAWIQRAG